jgi:hypothetical protein
MRSRLPVDVRFVETLIQRDLKVGFSGGAGVPAQCYVYEPPGEREAELWAARE